ncbi:MAG: Fic family protein [Bacteroidota bacterium]
MQKIRLSEYIAGHWVKQTNYKAFVPTSINAQWLIDDPEVEAITAQAHQKLGELNAFAELIPDVDFFIKMHIAKEAALSSKIEGTQTSVEEAFLNKQDIRPEERDDWQEVQNYIEAMRFAIARLKELPISNRLIRETHQKLLQGVRGQHKLPGEFRHSQNWIGGATLRDAIFVPPPYHEVQNLMGELEQFLHNDQIYISELTRIAIAHYQFETIHPFLDGNGRMGRLLITLYLVSKQMLTRPALYLSAFFEQHRSIYYDNLTNVRNYNNMKQWLKFFMVGVIETSSSSISTFRKISQLKSELEQQIMTLGRKQGNSYRLLQHLFSKPVTTANEVETILEVSTPTANTLLKDFVQLNILKERTGYRRNRVFSFVQYIGLFQ